MTHETVREANFRIYFKMSGYFKFFFFSGQGPLIATSVHKTSFLKRLFIQLPAIISIILMALLLVFECLFLFKSYNTNDINSGEMLIILVVFLEAIVSIITYSQSITQQTELNAAVRHIQFLINYMHSKFQHEISFDPHLRETQRCILKIILLFIGGIVFYAIVRVYVIQRPGDSIFFIDILQIPPILATMHCIFYINLLTYMMAQLNLLMKQKNICGFCKQRKLTRMHTIAWTHYCHRGLCNEIRLTAIKRMKLIYYRLWRASGHTMDFFGWTIASIFMLNFVVSSVALYWGYIVLVSNKHLEHINLAIIVPVMCAVLPLLLTSILIDSAQKLYAQVNSLKKFFCKQI